MSKKIFLFILVIIFVNESEIAQVIKDLIPTVNLTDGIAKRIVISDLFYSEDYNVKLLPNKYVNADYNSDQMTLTLQTIDFIGYTLLQFQLDSSRYAIPIYSGKNNEVAFSIKRRKGSKVFLFGSFNNWNREQYPLSFNESSGRYEVTVPLDYGTHEYKFLADDEEIIDPENSNKIPNGLGSENSIITLTKPESKIYLHLINYERHNKNVVINFFIESINHELNKNEVNLNVLLNNSLLENGLHYNGNIVSISLPAKVFNSDNYIRVTCSEGALVSNTQFIRMVNQGNGEPNFSWYDGTIYSIMIDRFMNGDKTIDKPVIHDSIFVKANYMGGDLNGIIKKIDEDYFDSLGINIIWISPVYDNPDEAFKEYPAPHRWYSGYHGYWPISATEVEPKFGSMQILKELVKKAHKHNIKILLDFVSNHVHEQHPFYKKHPEWFGKLQLPDGRLNLRFWDEFRLTTWFEPYMPSFDYIGSDEAIETMVSNAIWWLNESGADGFRHDAVKHVPNIFWRELTKKIKEEFGNKHELSIYQIGETFGDYDLVSSYVNNGQLDAQFNFNLYNIAQKIFIDSSASFKMLDAELNKTYSVYGVLNKMGNIMDSHDKNRYMAYADGDLTLDQWSAGEIGWNNPPKVDDPYSYKKAELYYAYMFTIPGLPVIYYGSEFGMTGASDPDNRRMMRFNNELDKYEKSMLKNVRKLSSIRNSNSALRYGDFYTLVADESIFAYVRTDLYERVLVVLNKADNNQIVSLKIPEFYNVKNITDLYTGDSHELDGLNFELSIPASGWKIFKLISE